MQGGPFLLPLWGGAAGRAATGKSAAANRPVPRLIAISPTRLSRNGGASRAPCAACPPARLREASASPQRPRPPRRHAYRCTAEGARASACATRRQTALRTAESRRRRSSAAVDFWLAGAQRGSCSSALPDPARDHQRAPAASHARESAPANTAGVYSETRSSMTNMAPFGCGAALSAQGWAVFRVLGALSVIAQTRLIKRAASAKMRRGVASWRSIAPRAEAQGGRHAGDRPANGTAADAHAAG